VTAAPEPAGSPVTAVRRTSRGPSAALALIAVVTALTGAIVVALLAGPAPSPSPSDAALVSAPPSASASPSPAPSATPAPVTSTVVVLRGEADPPGALGALTGCAGVVRQTSDVLTPAIQPADVDSVAAQAGRDSGWLFVPPGIQASSRVWLGEDLVGLALAAGQPLVAVDPKGDVWLGGRAGATRWIPITTPGGRTAWVMAKDAVVGDGDCSPWTVPQVIAGQRSVTCSGLGEPACLHTLSQAIAQTSELVYPRGDVVVSVDPCRVKSAGCSNALTSVIAAPEGWPVTTTALRAGQPDPKTGAFALTDERQLPTYVLDAMRRPSLPLPTGGEQATDNDCSETLTGELQGSPWDPRVAWVANLTVVWPSGTSAWFVPNAIVEVIGKTDGTAARAGSQVQLSGHLDETGQRFNACAMQLSYATALNIAPAPSTTAVGETPAVTPAAPSGRGTGS
jgi:hypothetical protein